MAYQNIAILATGDELIEGKTINTNTAAIAQYLFSEGFKLGLQMTCGDKEQDIIDSLNYLGQTHDLIITIGGLGPTSDDRTRFAVGKFVDLPLISHQAACEHIYKLTKRTALEPGVKQQTLFPEKTALLANPFGTAMGGFIPREHCSIILLPGPPRECLPMFQHWVLPTLKQHTAPGMARLSWLVFGLREEYVGRILDQALAEFPDCETGYRLDPPYVECKIRAPIEDEQKMRNIIEPLFTPHLLLSSTQKASEMLIQFLSHRKQSFSIKDLATGGLLQQLISTPQTYPYLCFTENNADFECAGLEHYWQQMEAAENTVYFKSNLKAASAALEASFPFRSKLILNAAAEWLCAQIFSCLNRIH